MAKWILSAFADEAASTLNDQLAALEREKIARIELRGVNGKNCADLSLQEAAEVKAALDEHGVKLSALGSPYGKMSIQQPFDDHFALFRHGLAVCKTLGCDRVRMFSFYMPGNESPEKWRDEVLARLRMMVNAAEDAGVLLVHENEKGIYGDTDDRCGELLDALDGRMGCVFDPANFVQCGVATLPAFDKLRDRITYMHIKDAVAADGAVVTAGSGDGHVTEILKMLGESRNDEVILTVEPHLQVFAGLEKLQSEALKHHQAYASSAEAFHAACAALQGILNTL